MDLVKFTVAIAVIIYISNDVGNAKSHKWLKTFTFSLLSVVIAYYFLGFSLKDSTLLGLTGILIVLADTIWP